MTLKVIVWTSGMTARAGAKGVLGHPDLELVGLYAYSKGKVGRDVGELIGVEPLGIAATDDVDALLALRPDCIFYAPFRPNIDHVEKILAAGVNLVTPMYKLAGAGYGPDAQARIAAACEAGGATLYSSGLYPGSINLIALAASGMMRRVDKITVLESVDFSGYANEAMYRAMGMDLELDDPRAMAALEEACGSLKEVVRVMAQALDAELDEVRFEGTLAAANETTDFGFMTIQKGRIAGFKGVVSGVVGGVSRFECQFTWQMGEDLTPAFPLEKGYLIRLEGDPNLEVRVTPEHDKERKRDGGAAATAMGCVNAIPQVVAAPPGVLNHIELPFIKARGRVGLAA
jgi:hypothetical protein